MNTKSTDSWLWPDHTISKAQSRQLREQHNALVNSHADLLAALKEIAQRGIVPGYESGSALQLRVALTQTIARAAIKKAGAQ